MRKTAAKALGGGLLLVLGDEAWRLHEHVPCSLNPRYFYRNLSQGTTWGIPGYLSEARPKKLNWRFFLPPVIGKRAPIHSESWRTSQWQVL